MYHISLLKQWHNLSSQESQAALLAANPERNEQDEEEEEVEEHFLLLREQRPEIIHSQDTHLTAEQKTQLEAVVSEFPSIFNSTPGKTSLVEHLIHVGDAAPVRQIAYHLPYSKREQMCVWNSTSGVGR